jgi:exopolysaccharide biosynthesis polyprenyl glycosylphosphotransferase
LETSIQSTAQDKILPLNRRQRQFLITAALLFGDVLTLIAAFSLAYILRFIMLPYERTFSVEGYGEVVRTFSLGGYALIVAAIIPLWLLIFAFNQLYSSHILFGGFEEYIRVFYSVNIGTLAIVVFGFFTRDDQLVSRGWLLISWGLALFLVVTFRFAFRHFIFGLRNRGHLLSPALIIGANDEGIALAEQLQKSSTSGLFITGFIDVGFRDEVRAVGSTVYNSFEVLGRLDDLESVINDENVEELIIASSNLRQQQLLTVYQSSSSIPGLNLRLTSGLFEIISTGMRAKELASVPLIEVNKNRISGVDATLKLVLDYGLSILTLALIWPFMLLIAIIIRLDTSGPTIYRRRVMGVGGHEFDAFKFRTMHTDGDKILANNPGLQEELDCDYKLIDDPRVTKVGRFLRKLSLDELPQLFNVLLGQMSLVGPRMISPPEMDKYGKWGLNLLTVKPGITGLWQISGRSDVSYDERVRIDFQYIRNWTIWKDIYILLATIPVVIIRKGAY